MYKKISAVSSRVILLVAKRRAKSYRGIDTACLLSMMHFSRLFIPVIIIACVLMFEGAAAEKPFPSFTNAVPPVEVVPDWGRMRSAEEWNRSYAEIPPEEFVELPKYDLHVLTKPLWKILSSLTEENLNVLTAKLTYSTRHFGEYDLNAGEFVGMHPGVDIKLPLGMPVSSVGAGKVHAVREEERLGRYIIIEHRTESEEFFYSIYGHLEEVIVEPGEKVSAGDEIGTVGMIGNTTGSHLHFQIDRKVREGEHEPYFPGRIASREEAEMFTVSPMGFMARFGDEN